MIIADGKMSSLLDFKKAHHEALSTIGQGEKIDWYLDLGLVDRLTHPFGDEREGRALHLSIDYFLKTLWAEFKDYTRSVILYKGSPELSIGFENPFDASLAFSEYLDYLTVNIPDSVPLALQFETIEPLDSLTAARLINRELYGRYDFTLNGHSLEKKGDKALLLPSVQVKETEIYNELMMIYAEKPELKIISEPFLTSEWDGLNELHVSSKSITFNALRKLKGFNAAGGTVFSYGEPLNLPIEQNTKIVQV